MLNVLESTVRFTPLWCSDHQTAPLLGFSGRAPSDRFCISLKHNQRKQVPRLMSGYLQQHFHKAKSVRDKDKARLTEEALFPLVFPTLIIAQHLQTQPGERAGSLTRSELGKKKKKNLISRNMIQSFWVLSLCQAEVPVYYRKILILPLTFASCLVSSIISLSFYAFYCDVIVNFFLLHSLHVNTLHLIVRDSRDLKQPSRMSRWPLSAGTMALKLSGDCPSAGEHSL